MKKNIFIAASSLFIAFLVFTACGLDTIPIVNPPTVVIHEPVYSSADFSSNYFDFRSAPSSATDIKFLGTAVYYRIYASYSTMVSRQSSISAVNTSSDYSAAANRMIGYGYQQLNTSDGNIQPLISDSDIPVYIRLANYGAGDYSANQYAAWIKPLSKVPRRTVTVGGRPKTFDFGRHDKPSKYDPDLNSLPASGDEDYENGTVENNKYYVDMYAVAIGIDTTFTRHYSQVLHLGVVPIDASKEDN